MLVETFYRFLNDWQENEWLEISDNHDTQNFTICSDGDRIVVRKDLIPEIIHALQLIHERASF